MIDHTVTEGPVEPGQGKPTHYAIERVINALQPSLLFELTKAGEINQINQAH
ncbi:MAG: hypothetical protein ACI81P_003621 [Neolewinella sp.]|jgi:hypothetical protein